MKSEKQLIAACARGQKTAQYELVKRYSGMLMTVCRRYTRDTESAKDILQEAFIRIFDKIDTYKHTGSFEAWIRKVTVRCALNWMKLSSNRIFSSVVELEEYIEFEEASVFDSLGSEEIVTLIQSLPAGFRTVFNLHSVEGYNHREIGEILGITESASRSQLSRARVILRKKVQLIDSVNYRSA